jgi:hypothetical protein
MVRTLIFKYSSGEIIVAAGVCGGGGNGEDTTESKVPAFVERKREGGGVSWSKTGA